MRSHNLPTGSFPYEGSPEPWVYACARCPLHETRHKAVWGGGAVPAPVMFVGDAPGRTDDEVGDPFVGSSGKMLDRMIVAMGFRRQDVYLTNLVKCRPPHDRSSTIDEIRQCQAYLRYQVLEVAPKIVIAMGTVPAQMLTGKTTTLEGLIGKRFPLVDAYRYGAPTDRPMVVTIQHPADIEAAAQLVEMLIVCEEIGAELKQTRTADVPEKRRR